MPNEIPDSVETALKFMKCGNDVCVNTACVRYGLADVGWFGLPLV